MWRRFLLCFCFWYPFFSYPVYAPVFSPSLIPQHSLGFSSSLLEKTLISPALFPHHSSFPPFIPPPASSRSSSSMWPPRCIPAHTGSQQGVRDLLSNICMEMDQVLLIYYPLLCALNSAGVERNRDETTLTHVSVAWWNETGKVNLLFWTEAQINKTEFVCFI